MTADNSPPRLIDRPLQPDPAPVAGATPFQVTAGSTLQSGYDYEVLIRREDVDLLAKRRRTSVAGLIDRLLALETLAQAQMIAMSGEPLEDDRHAWSLADLDPEIRAELVKAA